MMPKELSDIRRKLKVLNYAKEIGNAAAACRYFGISRETFHKWKRLTSVKASALSSTPSPARRTEVL